MTLRGQAAFTGIAELKPTRRLEGRTDLGLAAEVAIECIEDSGIPRGEIDGLIVDTAEGNIGTLVDYLQLPVVYGTSVDNHGATGNVALMTAAAVVSAGIANNVLCITSSEASPRQVTIPPTTYENNFDSPFGPVIAANGYYGTVAARHAYEYGTTDEQRAKIAVDQRYNAQANPNASFYGTPVTLDDVLASRMVCDPLRLLECVMPTLGGAAVMVTRADRAKSTKQPPVYLLGAGFCPKGEGGPFVESTDLTSKGDLPRTPTGGSCPSASRATPAGCRTRSNRSAR